MNTRSRALRKSMGSFYTPSHLAEQIAEEVLNLWLLQHVDRTRSESSVLSTALGPLRRETIDLLRNIRVLDPAVGDGAFLLSTANWLENTLVSLGDTRSQTDMKQEIVSENLYGVDIDGTAVNACRRNLADWAGPPNASMEGMNIVHGNSLVNFDWDHQFDVVLGNPPYGNILTEQERAYIVEHYPTSVGGGRSGTWNSAAHFIVRSSMFLHLQGMLGFLVPNSILRVGQFKRTREFILQKLGLVKIVDEGSPFDDVTLEMVTLICRASPAGIEPEVIVESRRQNRTLHNRVNRDILASGRLFPIYHDAIHAELLRRGKRTMLRASRGRDIPKDHISRTQTDRFRTPFITSGRSVKRFRIDERYLLYADDWYMQDSGLLESCETEILVATKNYRFPRCVVKPKGVIHGGGIVRIEIRDENINMRAVGLILNSRLMQHVCTRYLTNYSQLTTCLNTGIMEDIPIAVPKDQETFASLFGILKRIHSAGGPRREQELFETLGNALVYELYFGNGQLEESLMRNGLIVGANNDLTSVARTLESRDIRQMIDNVYALPQVAEIESRLMADMETGLS